MKSLLQYFNNGTLPARLLYKMILNKYTSDVLMCFVTICTYEETWICYVDDDLMLLVFNSIDSQHKCFKTCLFNKVRVVTVGQIQLFEFMSS